MAETTLPRGVRNNNPLNIRLSSQVFRGEVTNIYEKEFKCFRSMVWGFRAAFCIIRTYITLKGCKTPRQIIHRWCPDDSAARYVDFVCSRCNVDPDGALSFVSRLVMVALVSAMAKFETGVEFPQSLVDKGYQLAISNKST